MPFYPVLRAAQELAISHGAAVASFFNIQSMHRFFLMAKHMAC
jgi:hypothetical protein